jgi:hypothetical protein
MQRKHSAFEIDADRAESPVAAFDDEPDMTLVEEMLRLKMSDRLRTLTRYGNALRRFRSV